MDGLILWKRQLVLVAFAQAVRKAEFSQGPKKILVAATVRDTIGYLSQTSNSVLRDNLRRDQDGSFSFLLEQTFKEYVNEDPGVKQQKAIPIIVLLKLLDLAHTELATAMKDNVCADFFFLMRP